MSILTGRKKTAFSRMNSSMHAWPLLQSTPFLHYSCPPSISHTIDYGLRRLLSSYGHTVTANLIKFAAAICEIWAFKVSFQFLRFFLIIRLMPYGRGFDYKNANVYNSIPSVPYIIGTDEERVTVDSRTTFAVNLRNIQGVKDPASFCHGYRPG